MYWGLAAYYAQRAYSSASSYLGLAVNNWQLATQSFVPPNGTLPRSASVTSNCTSELISALIVLKKGSPIASVSGRCCISGEQTRVRADARLNGPDTR